MNTNDYDPYDDDANLAEDQALVRQEQAQRRLQALLDRRPPVFAKDGDLDPAIAAWADRYTEGDTGNLILFGAVGVGKTWSLWKAAETLVAGGWRGRFEVASSYELKEATDRPVDKDQLRIWRDADLFALDDLGAQRINDWDTDAIFALIDHRWQHQRPTLIASNEMDLISLVGERTSSRFRDGATILLIAGDDHRQARS